MRDFDLRSPDPDPDNLSRLSIALDKLESRKVDVIHQGNGVPSYSQLAQDAIESELLGIPVRVCSLARLREMKREQNRTQDQLDLENLPED